MIFDEYKNPHILGESSTADGRMIDPICLDHCLLHGFELMNPRVVTWVVAIDMEWCVAVWVDTSLDQPM